MGSSIHIQKVRTPASARPTTGVPASGLPEDMILDASKRLGFAALIYVATFFLAYFVNAIPAWIRMGALVENLRALNSIVAYIAILMSLLIFFLSRKAAVRSHLSGKATICPDLVLNLGLVYEVIATWGISMSEFWGSFPDWEPGFMERVGFFGIPWECVWIIIFPVIAPNRPWKTFVASLAAASTGLVTIALSRAYGGTSTDPPMFFFVRYFLFTTYLCAFIALVVAHGIHKLGTRIQRDREVGSYRLSKLLGKGGMGEVWLAKHRMLARPAAIKLIRPEVLGSDQNAQRSLLRRFEREAQATASLQSYHTIDVYDFGMTEDGSFYYVMELLDGLDLHSLVKKFGPVPAGRAVHLLRQACHSLMDAHENGMIHRDIKPANIYVCRLGPDCDFVKVLDFGLVKSSREEDAGDTQITVQGIAPGTPGFMAPEMALGKGAVDGRSDLYSLGCVGYWLLTGELVFEGDSPMATVLQHVQTPPVPPSERTEMEIPECLEKIILSCLEKDPAKRPQSARELDRQLAAGDAAAAWTDEDAREWWNLHRPQSESVLNDLGEEVLHAERILPKRADT